MTTYAVVLASNIRAERARAGLDQKALAARMRALGFGRWAYQTVGKVENNQRPVYAPEIIGLAICLETTVPALMGTAGRYDGVELPGGITVAAEYVEHLVRGVNDRAVRWDGSEITVV